MSIKAKNIIGISIGIIFWISVWEISAFLIDVRFLFPTFSDVVSALCREAFSDGALTFWGAIFFSLLRVLIGLLTGVILGVSLAILAHYVSWSTWFIRPIVTLLRCTPVASFIMILWLLISDFYVPSIISAIIVFPVIWDTAFISLSNPSKELSDVAAVFGFSYRKRFLLISLPEMIKAVIPAVITSAGLAWKSGIAAEIITYTKNSIGRFIADSKNQLEGADLFAWTLVVILLSIAVEFAIKALLKKVRSLWD